MENLEEKLLVPSFCSPALPWLLLAAEDPIEAISSAFGALLCCWVLCLGEAQHSPENSPGAARGRAVVSGAEATPSFAIPAADSQRRRMKALG